MADTPEPDRQCQERMPASRCLRTVGHSVPHDFAPDPAQAAAPEWAVALDHELSITYCDLAPTRQARDCSACTVRIIAAAFDAQAGKLREERDTASKLYKEAHEMAARETGRLVDQLRQAEERAEADATEIMRLQGELAEERGRIAKEKP